jgi:hypothetical protein
MKKLVFLFAILFTGILAEAQQNPNFKPEMLTCQFTKGAAVTVYKSNQVWLKSADSADVQTMSQTQTTGFFNRMRGIWASQPKPGQHKYSLDLRSVKPQDIQLKDEHTGEVASCGKDAGQNLVRVP